MICSKLTDVLVPAHASNYTKTRLGKKICKITIHHVAGVNSAEGIGRIFQNSNRNASSNYGIGNDGRIGCYVSEDDRAWTSSNGNNDLQAITIEVSNSSVGGEWLVSDKALASLIRLCKDICSRYGFKLFYDNTPNGSLTRHNMFAKTTCPGPYLQGLFPYIVQEVNKEDLPIIDIPKTKKQYVTLPITANTWRVYPLNKSANTGNEIGFLKPSKFGGLKYEVLRWSIPNVVAIIKTRDFGDVQIYVDPNKTSAKITSE